jgi:hypothetical protein
MIGKPHSLASSPRTRGPITPGVNGVTPQFGKDIHVFSKHKRHGVAMSASALTLGVPAFAGTTDQYGV